MTLLALGLLMATGAFAHDSSGAIQPGDRVRIQCAEEPSISRDYRVTQQGTVLIDFLGAVKIAGMTRSDAADTISKRLVSDRVLHKASVSIDNASATSISDPGIASVKWSGQVDNASQIPYRSGLTLADVWPAIRPAANADITVVQIINPTASPRNVFLKEGLDLRTIALSPNDEIILVPKVAPLSKVFVGGEVAQPGMYEFTSTTTLPDLIKSAGGVAPHGDSEQVELQHTPTDTKTIKTSEPNLRLTDGDKLIVPKRAPDMKIFIGGQVRKPGSYGVYNGTRLQDLVIQAGGFTNDALRNKVSVSTPGEDKPKVLDMQDVELGYVGDVVLKPGMKVDVPGAKGGQNGDAVRFGIGAAVLFFLIGK